MSLNMEYRKETFFFQTVKQSLPTNVLTNHHSLNNNHVEINKKVTNETHANLLRHALEINADFRIILIYILLLYKKRKQTSLNLLDIVLLPE